MPNFNTQLAQFLAQLLAPSSWRHVLFSKFLKFLSPSKSPPRRRRIPPAHPTLVEKNYHGRPKSLPPMPPSMAPKCFPAPQNVTHRFSKSLPRLQIHPKSLQDGTSHGPKGYPKHLTIACPTPALLWWCQRASARKTSPVCIMCIAIVTRCRRSRGRGSWWGARPSSGLAPLVPVPLAPACPP